MATGLATLLFFCLPGFLQDPGEFTDTLTWECLGPTSMGGRIVDLAVRPDRRSTFFVATASGGLFRTTNNGTTFEAVFDRGGSASTGAVCIAPSCPEIVWLGTGEANPRNSVSWGDGVYRSVDGGSSWECVGLRDTRHIGRIAVDPRDPGRVYVAALGHLWGPSQERGLYRTCDGGRTFERVLWVDENTGCIDVLLDPRDPDVVFAATWEVRRDAFDGGRPSVATGPESGLWRSTNGGESWERLVRGLPAAPLGRIGLAAGGRDSTVLYAIVETPLTGKEEPAAEVEVDRPESEVQGGQFANLQVSQGPGGVETGGVFRSLDGGEVWTRVNSLNPRPFYFSQIRVHPRDAEEVYVLGVQLHRSRNGGATFDEYLGDGIHPDHHALWIDPEDPDHLLLGGDGGVYVTYDRCRSWEFLDRLPIGQFYGVAVDLQQPYYIYGGLQDNGTWGGPRSAPRRGPGLGVLQHDWFKIAGGDGFRCALDPRDPSILYHENQFGHILCLDLRSGDQFPVRAPDPGQRFHWNTPFLLSRHAPGTLYFAGTELDRSTDGGHTSRTVTPGLRLARTPRGTATALAESPLEEGLLYVGTDDGNLWRVREGSGEWLRVSDSFPPLPGPYHVSRVVASQFRPAVVYATLDGHRSDDAGAYVLRSEDCGEHWVAITSGIDRGPARCILEDDHNENLLFLGTEFGCYGTLDRGDSWFALGQGLPTVAVYDLVVHPRDGELVAGTHGRGLWVLDVTPLQQLTPEALGSTAYLFQQRPRILWNRLPSTPLYGAHTCMAENGVPEASIYYYVGRELAGGVVLTVRDTSGRLVTRISGPGSPGVQWVRWNLRGVQPPNRLVAPGSYEVTLEVPQTAVPGNACTTLELWPDPTSSDFAENLSTTR